MGNSVTSHPLCWGLNPASTLYAHSFCHVGSSSNMDSIHNLKTCSSANCPWHIITCTCALWQTYILPCALGYAPSHPISQIRTPGYEMYKSFHSYIPRDYTFSLGDSWSLSQKTYNINLGTLAIKGHSHTEAWIWQLEFT